MKIALIHDPSTSLRIKTSTSKVFCLGRADKTIDTIALASFMSIGKKAHRQKNKKRIREYKSRFKKPISITALKKTGNEDLDPLKHSIDLIYIRGKFLFNALVDQIEKKNAFAVYALLKSFWETTALLGYVVIEAEHLVTKKEFSSLLAMLRRLIMGGRNFPSEEMVKNKGATKEEYTQPNLLTMMDKIDKHWNNKFKKQGYISHFRNEYDEFVAEAGHPTYLGLHFSGRWSKGKHSLTPDQNKSWSKLDEYQAENDLAMSVTFFFYFYDRFLKLIRT